MRWCKIDLPNGRTCRRKLPCLLHGEPATKHTKGVDTYTHEPQRKPYRAGIDPAETKPRPVTRIKP